MEKLKLLQDFANNDLNCSLYILLNGYIAYNASTSNSNSPSNSFTNTTLSYPYFFLTNCSNSTAYNTGPVQLSQLYDNLTVHNDGTLLRDPFSNGFISVCYIVSAVTVAAWSLVLLLVLSTTTKSHITSFLTLFYAITISVVLLKTTTLLDRQFFYNYQNADQFASEVLESNVSVAFTIIMRLLTVIAWGEILVYVFSVKRRKLIRNCTAFSFLLLLLFNVLYYAYAKEDNHSTTNNYTNFNNNNGTHKKFGKVERFFEVMVCVIDLAIYCVFCVTMYCYIYWKRAFAFIGSIVCLTVFTGVLLLCPIVFYLAYVISNKVNNWSSLLSYFFPVLINILVWELVYKVQKLEKINESKTIIGRAISNDEFSVTNHKRAGDSGNDRNGGNDDGWDPSFSSYHFKNPILKSQYRNKLKRIVGLQTTSRASNANKSDRDQREENEVNLNYSNNNMGNIDNPDNETNNDDGNNNINDCNRSQANNKKKKNNKSSITNKFTNTINIPSTRQRRNWGRSVYNINRKNKNKTEIKRDDDGIVNINENGNNILLHNLTEIQVATPVNDTATTTASPTNGYGSTPINVGNNLGVHIFGNDRNSDINNRNSGGHIAKERDDNNNGRNENPNNSHHDGKEGNNDNNYRNLSNSNINLSLREVNDDTPSHIGSAPQETVITGTIDYQHQH